MEILVTRERRGVKAGTTPLSGWSVEVQGKRISVKCQTGLKPSNKGKTRGFITCFSRKARARRLKWIASVDWLKAGAGFLVTVTYPDEQSNHTMEERKTQRYLLNRWIVERCERDLGCFWRVEWKSRLTGKYLGEMRPHMHLLYMGFQTVNFRGIRERWEEIIGAQEYTQIDVTYVSVGNMVSVYAAKYCSKEASASYLDNVPYRNRTGRHTGEFRRNLIPMHPLETVSNINQAILTFLKGEACRTLWWFDPRFDEGFTIIGDEALKVIKEFHGLQVDEYGEEMYTIDIK